jgi:hypothetical protein
VWPSGRRISDTFFALGKLCTKIVQKVKFFVKIILDDEEVKVRMMLTIEKSTEMIPVGLHCLRSNRHGRLCCWPLDLLEETA